MANVASHTLYMTNFLYGVTNLQWFYVDCGKRGSFLLDRNSRCDNNLNMNVFPVYFHKYMMMNSYFLPTQMKPTHFHFFT